MIYDFAEIKNKIKFYKDNKKIVGLCHGVFDILHFGHIKHFEFAKKKCDILIVSITSDKFIFKGPNRPVHNENERLYFLNNLKLIDFAFIAKGDSGVKSINFVKPNFYFKGNDYKKNFLDKTGKILDEIRAVKNNKGKIIYTNEKQMSSSKIINQIGLALNNDQSKFINEIKKRFSFSYIIKALDKLKKNKVIVVGDLILDNYIYGDVLGKSGKEPHMVFRESKQKLFLGGSSIISNHLADFVKSVTLITDCGNETKIVNLLKKQIKKNIKHITILPDKNYKSCIKTRFVDTLSSYKLFGSYIIPNLKYSKFYKLLGKNIINQIEKHEIIIIADYSNNFFNKNNINLIRKSKKFISAMIQKNSNNPSFFSLNYIKEFDLVCINESELRSELKDNETKIDNLAEDFLIRNKLKFLVITKGKSGSLLIDSKLNRYNCPAFNLKPIDKVGAGDSMLSILSIFLKNNIDPMISLLAASLISSEVVNNIGNSFTASRKELERNLEFLLK